MDAKTKIRSGPKSDYRCPEKCDLSDRVNKNVISALPVLLAQGIDSIAKLKVFYDEAVPVISN